MMKNKMMPWYMAQVRNKMVAISTIHIRVSTAFWEAWMKAFISEGKK